ncbi:MAG TPA: hypothetical protein VHH90_06460 [Polyangia bacterium]|nr:hypothetical protein [Polyangia bacterium]
MSRDADPKTDPKPTRLFDKRTVERNIKKGLISRKDYEKYVKTLDDVGDKGVYGLAEGRDEPHEPPASAAAEPDETDEDNQPGD